MQTDENKTIQNKVIPSDTCQSNDLVTLRAADRELTSEQSSSIIIKDTRELILSYLNDQVDINTNALQAYEVDTLDKYDPEIKKMRETEAIKLRDRIYELNRHIAVIKRM